MNLTTLTHRDALCLNARFTSREEAIHALTQRLAALGKISSTEQFLEEVYRRESLGPTALGEGLAVPPMHPWPKLIIASGACSR